MAFKIHAGPAELPNALVVEGKTSEAMLPGNVAVVSSGEFALADAATVGQLLFMKEKGPGQGGHVDDEFAVDDYAYAYVARSGLFFRTRVATGLTLVANETLLERGADGQLAVLDAGEAVAVAKETVTTSSDDELVLVEVL